VDGHDGGVRHDDRDRSRARGENLPAVAGLPKTDKNIRQFEGSENQSWQEVSRCCSCALKKSHRFRFPSAIFRAVEKGFEKMVEVTEASENTWLAQGGRKERGLGGLHGFLSFWGLS
jgi:hypothetical protein